MKRFIVLLVVLFALFAFSMVVVAKDDDKVTICHAAGQAGTTKYVTITVSRNALKGHFEENGTTAAGHEQDYMGPCKQTQPSGSPTPSPTVTGKPVPTASAAPSPTAPGQSNAPSSRPSPRASGSPAIVNTPRPPTINTLPSTSTN